MRWRIAAAAVVLGLPAVALLGFGLTRDPREIPSPLPGRPAPAFALPVFAPGTPPVGTAPSVGDSIRLASLRGDIVVVNFWASWCLACRGEHASLAAVGAQYAGTDVHFMGVLYNDSPENGVRWIQQLGGQPYPSLQDEGARTAIDYGVYGVPETYLIDRTGHVAYKQTGPVTDSVLIAKIEALRAATPKQVGSR